MQIPDPKLITHMQRRLKSFFSCGHGITVRVGVGTGSALQLLKQAIRTSAHSVRHNNVRVPRAYNYQSKRTVGKKALRWLNSKDRSKGSPRSFKAVGSDQRCESVAGYFKQSMQRLNLLGKGRKISPTSMRSLSNVFLGDNFGLLPVVQAVVAIRTC